MEQPDMSNTMQDLRGVEDTVNNILQTVARSKNIDGVLTDVASEIGSLSQADVCIIVSAVDGKPNQIDYWQHKSDSWLTQEIIALLVDLPLSHDVLTQVESLFAHPFVDRPWLGQTTQYQAQTNGLVLLFKSESERWTNYAQELLAAVSNSTAIAISQVQLQQQAHSQSRHHTLLKNLSRQISQSSHPDLIFKNCLSQICNTLQLDRGMILMLKYQNPLQAKSRGNNKSIKGTVEIACQWSKETNNIAPDKQFFSFSHSDLCQQAWQNAPQYSCFTSGKAFPDLPPRDEPTLIQSNGEALLMMPLMGKKNSVSQASVWGFLVLQHDSDYYWSEDELDLIDWVAVQISTAIVNHQTLSQVQSIVDDRTAQLQWSLDVQAKLSEKMRQHINQLQKLNQLKDDFMNSMSHELKTPLTSMKMAIMMLRRPEIAPQMRDKYLDILEQEWNREYNLIKDLLKLQELESGELAYSPEELDLNQTINDLAQSFQDKWAVNKGLKIETKISESNLKINTDSDSLTNVLNELLVNAGKYSAADTTIELTVDNQTTLKGKNIAIKIANYGVGITQEELPHVFDKFRRGAGVTDRAVPGTGLGLTLVQNLVEHLNGQIYVTSEPVEQDHELFVTNFVLELPQFQPAIS